MFVLNCFSSWIESVFWKSLLNQKVHFEIQNLNGFKNASLQSLNLWTWPEETLADFPGNVENLDPIIHGCLLLWSHHLVNDWVYNGRPFVSFKSILFPFTFFLMLFIHQVHNIWFSDYHQVFPKFWLYMEHFSTLFYRNDQTVSNNTCLNLNTIKNWFRYSTNNPVLRRKKIFHLTSFIVTFVNAFSITITA